MGGNSANLPIRLSTVNVGNKRQWHLDTAIVIHGEEVMSQSEAATEKDEVGCRMVWRVPTHVAWRASRSGSLPGLQPFLASDVINNARWTSSSIPPPSALGGFFAGNSSTSHNLLVSSFSHV